MISKYCDLAGSHFFFPVAIETARTWNQMAVELVQKIGRRITTVTEDTRETMGACHLLFNGKCGLLYQRSLEEEDFA